MSMSMNIGMSMGVSISISISMGVDHRADPLTAGDQEVEVEVEL